MCVPGCQESLQAALSRRGFFRGAAAAGFAATAVLPAEAAKKAKAAKGDEAAKKSVEAPGIKAPQGQNYSRAWSI